MPGSPSPNPRRYTAFSGPARVAGGALERVAVRARQVVGKNPSAAILVFDDETGALVEVDLRGTAADVRRRVSEGSRVPTAAAPDPTPTSDVTRPRGPGRPRLGVVPREVTLLPRHWEWLNSQPGGASVALRRLVEEARRTSAGADRRRRSQEAAYRFMTAVAGDFAGYEEALRALFAGDANRFDACTQAWPADVRAYGRRLATDAFPQRMQK